MQKLKKNMKKSENFSNEDLIKLAIKAKENSYSPYWNFPVGAVLLTKSGKVFVGTNVENSSFPVGCCAERSAIFSAISNGEKEFEKLVVISNDKNFTYPCGMCRQVMAEFMPDSKIICAKSLTEYKEFYMKDLLPNSFEM